MTVPTVSPPTGVGRRLAAGIGAQGMAQVLLILGQLLIVPTLLAAWGAEVFADWLVLSAAAGILVLADLGIHGHLSNALRAAWARGDEAAGRRILQHGLGVYTLLAALTAVLVFTALAALDLPALLGIARLDDAGATLLLMALAHIVLMPRGLVATIYSARGRFDREVLTLTATLIAQQACAVLVGLAGGSPLQAAAAQFAATLFFGWGTLLWALRRAYGAVPLRPVRPTGAELRLLAAKAPLYAVHLVGMVALVNLPVLLLGRLAPADTAAAAVVTFTTIRTFTGIVRQTARQVAISLGLEMARMHACGKQGAAHRLYAESTPLVGCGVALLAGAAWAVGPAVFELWTHGTTPFDPLTGAAFLAGALLQVPAYGAAGLLRLIDRPEIVAAAQAAEIVAVVALAVLLIPVAGAAGAALAITLAETFASMPWHMRYAGRLLGQSVLGLTARAYGAAAVALAVALLAAAAADRLAPLTTAPGLAVFALLWFAAALPSLFAALGADRRTWVQERLRHSFHKKR